MPRGSSLASMTIEALLKLRDDVGAMLTEKTHELRKQLDRLEGGSGKSARRGAGRRSHPTKGSKLAPKFRGPDGETWAGRGARPRWLQAMLKQGHALEEFFVGEGEAPAAASSGKGRKKGRPGRKAKAAA
jgi:DNA-binding protein H-NS